MKSANIATAKNQLSRLLERVKQGETILITDRHRPVARLQPLAASDVEFEGLIASGMLTAPEEVIDVERFLGAPRGVSQPGKSLAAAVIEDREEGR
jgi:prevent-host-death family protein